MTECWPSSVGALDEGGELDGSRRIRFRAQLRGWAGSLAAQRVAKASCLGRQRCGGSASAVVLQPTPSVTEPPNLVDSGEFTDFDVARGRATDHNDIPDFQISRLYASPFERVRSVPYSRIDAGISRAHRKGHVRVPEHNSLERAFHGDDQVGAVDDVLSKPFEMDQLLRVVGRYVQKAVRSGE